MIKKQCQQAFAEARMIFVFSIMRVANRKIKKYFFDHVCQCNNLRRKEVCVFETVADRMPLAAWT